MCIRDSYEEKPTTFALALSDYGKDVEISAPE